MPPLILLHFLQITLPITEEQERTWIEQNRKLTRIQRVQIHGAFMRIELTSGHTVLADDADMELLLPYSWYLHRGGNGRLYAAARVRREGPKRVKMHRLITGAPQHLIVHHINNDGLDNRRCNLEVTTNRQNLRHHYDAIGGAYFDKARQRWRSGLRSNDGKVVHLGMFDTEEAAREAATEFRRTRLLAAGSQ